MLLDNKGRQLVVIEAVVMASPDHLGQRLDGINMHWVISIMVLLARSENPLCCGVYGGEML